MTLVPAVRKVVSGIDPTIPLTDVKTHAVQLDESIAGERCFASLAMMLALMAVVLSCVGLYSIMAYNVSRRINEIGLRMALGATSGNVAWTVLRSALITVTVGIAMGVPAVFATIRIVRSYLFGIEPYDPVTLIGAIALLIAVATLAAWLPARRAAKTDPMEALRYE
jgi:ABC-type antimicrobial peptide transport system permease subunit